tara:strand:+ start:97 stop:504 length:408 start_codon:yes stop_codon:yes gene_type:complete
VYRLGFNTERTHKRSERRRRRRRRRRQRRRNTIIIIIIMGEHATTQKTKTSSSSAPPGQHKAPPHHRAPELQLDAKWEAAIDVSLRRVVYGAIGGTTMALLMCRGTTARAAVSAFGVGVGVGSAYGDASKIFQQH